MRKIGVIDVLNGQTVAARAGQRSQYQPIDSALCEGSHPADIAQAFSDQRGIREFYLADLDRLSGRTPNLTAWKSVGDIADTLWLDAGIKNRADLQEIQSQPDGYIERTITICASESCEASSDLFHPDNSELDQNHQEKSAFGLDLRDGRIVSANNAWQALPTLDVVHKLIDQGWRRFVVLDVSAVGLNQGCPTVELCQAMRELSTSLRCNVEIVTGGGCRNATDLQRLEDAGCDAVLLSTALHRRQL